MAYSRLRLPGCWRAFVSALSVATRADIRKSILMAQTLLIARIAFILPTRSAAFIMMEIDWEFVGDGLGLQPVSRT